MNKSESKYFNTAVKMDEALLALLEKKEFAYITVKEVCERAGVHRSTFYLHYENTSDLLKETTQYLLDKHFSYYGVDWRQGIQKINEREPRELIFISEEFLIPYLTFIKENSRVFRVALKRFQEMNMDKVYETLFTTVFEPILARFSVPQRDRPYVIKFYLTGVFAIVMEWLERGCAEEIDMLVRIIGDCVMGGIGYHE